ncbi:hypothetical protein BU17DRAFT_78983 [Hysterangium stoloniferum]|nr:hypothetical protein BU17DRAFT_78983 [Hysterangium stoloniferum]
MSKRNVVRRMQVTTLTPQPGTCESCIMGKHTRRPFYINDERETTTGEHTYVDLWGPSRVQSIGGRSYMMPCVVGSAPRHDYASVVHVRGRGACVWGVDVVRTTRGWSECARRVDGASARDARMGRVRMGRGRGAPAWGVDCGARAWGVDEECSHGTWRRVDGERLRSAWRRVDVERARGVWRRVDMERARGM